jgi:hypothetical protein
METEEQVRRETIEGWRAGVAALHASLVGFGAAKCGSGFAAISWGCWSGSNGRTAGNWLSTSARPARRACNAC